MKELYITCLLALLCSVFGATAFCSQKADSKIKLAMCNPMEFSVRLQRIHDYNQFRFIAIIQADSLGITPEEYIAALNDGICEDAECEFYSSRYNN